jgi:hypothetical protein
LKTPDPYTTYEKKNQGCGSGSGLDPYSATFWIRIRIGNPDPGTRKLRNFIGKMHLLVIFNKNFTSKKGIKKH